MRKLMSGVGLVLIVMMIGIQPVKAQEGNAEEEEKHTHHHRIELFLGDTVEDGEHDFSPGLTYEYRPLRIFGIGAFWEFSHKKFDKFGLPFFIHPYKGLRIVLAPGLNYVSEEDNRYLFLFRTGVGYEFEIGRWSITPEMNYDFIEEGGNALVFGVSIGFGF